MKHLNNRGRKGIQEKGREETKMQRDTGKEEGGQGTKIRNKLCSIEFYWAS
jgi:hypothetical protein